jgi:dolichol-phosphate mannosyltransferase
LPDLDRALATIRGGENVAEILVIVPTYNEIDNLESIVSRISESVPEADILIVDDASPDGTGALAEQLATANSALGVLHRPAKNGLGVAYLAGFDRGLAGDYRFIVEIDADGSHDPAELPRMIDLSKAGADLVIGSRRVPGGAVANWPWFRRAISGAANRYARLMLRSQVQDLTAGYRVFRANALRSLDLRNVSSQGYCFQIELAWRLERAGARIAEHPITFIERENGHSKMRPAIVVEALWRVTLWGVRRRPD